MKLITTIYCLFQDNNRHLGDIKCIQVFGVNFFIDPLEPTKPVDLKGWNLVIVKAENNISDQSGGKPGCMLCKIPQSDNSMTFQPPGAQVNTFHGVEGIHSKYLQIILYFKILKILPCCSYFS